MLRQDHAPGSRQADSQAAWRVGDNVPWSVAWSGESSFHLQASTDFPGMVEVVQLENPGVGEPLFAAIHVSRHRRAMVEQLCHVCGLHTHKSDRYVFPVASGGLVTMHDGSLQYGCNVPPLHLACANRARRQCPHLGRLYDHPIVCPANPGRLIYRTDVAPGLEALAKQAPPGLDIVYSCYRLYEPAFTRRVERFREKWEREARLRRAADATRSTP